MFLSWGPGDTYSHLNRNHVVKLKRTVIILSNSYRHNCYVFYPPASEASREVANSTERKNPHTPVNGLF